MKKCVAGKRRLAQFERVEVVPLLNENATKANILSALKRLAGAAGAADSESGSARRLKRAEPEDTVIIYFAGHGTAQAQRFYLIPHDLGYTGERTKLNEARFEDNTVAQHFGSLSWKKRLKGSTPVICCW